MKRKMLSMKSSVSEPSSSRKCSATVSARQRHAQTRTRRLGHLAVNQSGLRFGVVVDVDHSGFLKFEPEVVALAGALTDAGENGEAAVLRGDVVDEFLDHDRFADTRAAEEAGLAALQRTAG